MDKITEIKEHIKKVYLAYNRPLVVGYSGGKDSMMDGHQSMIGAMKYRRAEPLGLDR